MIAHYVLCNHLTKTTCNEVVLGIDTIYVGTNQSAVRNGSIKVVVVDIYYFR